jgi:hypothetical protein
MRVKEEYEAPALTLGILPPNTVPVPMPITELE